MKKYLARRKNNDPIHKIIPMEIYIRHNSVGNFRKTFAKRSLGWFVKDYWNTFDPVSYYLRGYRISDKYAVRLLNYNSDWSFDGRIPNARVMLNNVTIPQALTCKEQIMQVEGVTDVMWLDDSCDITQPLETMDKDTVE